MEERIPTNPNNLVVGGKVSDYHFEAISVGLMKGEDDDSFQLSQEMSERFKEMEQKLLDDGFLKKLSLIPFQGETSIQQQNFIAGLMNSFWRDEDAKSFVEEPSVNKITEDTVKRYFIRYKTFDLMLATFIMRECAKRRFLWIEDWTGEVKIIETNC